MRYFTSTLGLTLPNERSLAENYILYGGTSTYASKNQDGGEVGDTVGSRTQGMNLRSGLNAYNAAGNREIGDYGYKPMPGITSVTIESTGKMGSLRQATINFKVWDKYQLDIMDALYFRPGFTVLIEYGHAKYYDNQGMLQSSEQFMINPFQGSMTKEDINLKLSTNTRKSYGNYGGMLGLVTSFNFTMTQDGGYDCTIKALSLGAVMGNYPINHVSTLSDVYYQQLKTYIDNERAPAIKAALDEIEAEKLKAIKEAENSIQTNGSNWAKLNITDKLSNLLFNTNGKNEGDFQVFRETEAVYIPILGGKNVKLSETELPIKTIVTPGGVINTAIGPVNGEIVNLDVEYYKTRASNLLKDFQGKNKLQNPASTQGIDAFYVKEGIIFFSSGPANLFQRYIADSRSAQPKDKTLLVKLDTDYINSIVTKSVDGIKTGTVSSEGETFVDKLPESVVRSNATYKRNVLTYSKDGTIFQVEFQYPKGDTIEATTVNKRDGRDFFVNPETQYIVERIDTDITNYTTVVLAEKANPSFKVYLGGNATFADLSLIKSIDGEQVLLYNKYLRERDLAVTEAERQAAAARTEKEKQILNEYNAESLRATTDSESTLELMLRSILLYGINNALNPALLRGKPYQDFIKNLFSEGAYSQIFKNNTVPKVNYDKYTPQFFAKYIEGTLTPAERLDTNFRYGNNFYLMSGENAYKSDSNGRMILKNQLRDESSYGSSQKNTFVPQVDFEQLFKILPVPYGESADLEVNNKPKLSVYINLGMFFLMINHTGILYNSETKEKIKKGDTITPMTYLDFNPETNFYLSSINQISIDPYKFLVPYLGTNQDYKKLFDESLIPGGVIKAIPPKQADPTAPPPATPNPTPLFNVEEDRLSGALPQQKNGMDNRPDGYIGKLMYVMVDINYLLDVIKSLKTGSDTNDVYFQSTLETILADLNKSMGNYNAFRLSYNDNSNCYVITDDQLQQKPDVQVGNSHSKMIQKSSAFEIPVFGKESVARAFEIRTDISSRLASYIAISTNPSVPDQVAASKNTSDIGVYNLGSFDRYIPRKTSETAKEENGTSNIPAAEMAINFNNVVKSIYTVAPESSENRDGLFISSDSIQKARSYYIDRMSKVKNEQSGSVHAMIIPLRSNITMDGISAIHPFQLYTIDERTLPYRYNSSKLSSGPDNQKKVAFSIARITHNFADNQWTTGIEGFMTLLREPNYDQKGTRSIEPSTIPISETDIFGYGQLNQAPINTFSSRTLTAEFLAELDKVCARLSCKRDDMIRVMFAESKLNPTALGPKNKADIPAYGLVQFTPPTYKSIGVTTYQEIPSDATKQLTYVEKYFNSIGPKRSSYSNLYELYGAVFLPAILTPANLKNDTLELAYGDLTAAQISLANPLVAEAAGKKPGQPLTIADFKKYVNKISYDI
jgi:hypothetical protein